jgi:hypothetical protein
MAGQIRHPFAVLVERQTDVTTNPNSHSSGAGPRSLAQRPPKVANRAVSEPNPTIPTAEEIVTDERLEAVRSIVPWSIVCLSLCAIAFVSAQATTALESAHQLSLRAPVAAPPRQDTETLKVSLRLARDSLDRDTRLAELLTTRSTARTDYAPTIQKLTELINTLNQRLATLGARATSAGAGESPELKKLQSDNGTLRQTVGNLNQQLATLRQSEGNHNNEMQGLKNESTQQKKRLDEQQSLFRTALSQKEHELSQVQTRVRASSSTNQHLTEGIAALRDNFRRPRSETLAADPEIAWRVGFFHTTGYDARLFEHVIEDFQMWAESEHYDASVVWSNGTTWTPLSVSGAAGGRADISPFEPNSQEDLDKDQALDQLFAPPIRRPKMECLLVVSEKCEIPKNPRWGPVTVHICCLDQGRRPCPDWKKFCQMHGDGLFRLVDFHKDREKRILARARVHKWLEECLERGSRVSFAERGR